MEVQVAIRRAKTLDTMMQAKLLLSVATPSNPHALRDQVMILLSYKAGLRAQEIAGLDWNDVCDAEGNVRADAFEVPSDIAKKGRARTVPMNPHLQVALVQLRLQRPNDVGVIYGIGRGRKRMTSDAVQAWFRRTYAENNFEDCSSHSGRRTFITRLAQKAGAHECSIRDVQMLAGHASLSTTERYIDASPHVARLVASI